MYCIHSSTSTLITTTQCTLRIQFTLIGNYCIRVSPPLTHRSLAARRNATFLLSTPCHSVIMYKKLPSHKKNKTKRKPTPHLVVQTSMPNQCKVNEVPASKEKKGKENSGSSIRPSNSYTRSLSLGQKERKKTFQLLRMNSPPLLIPFSFGFADDERVKVIKSLPLHSTPNAIPFPVKVIIDKAKGFSLFDDKSKTPKNAFVPCTLGGIFTLDFDRFHRGLIFHCSFLCATVHQPETLRLGIRVPTLRVLLVVIKGDGFE